MDALHHNEQTEEKEGDSDLNNSDIEGVEIKDHYYSPEEQKQRLKLARLKES
jgi:hypothetical protein